MSNFFNSSIGKKIIMSVTGLFLMLFLLLHLTINLLLLFGDGEIYNQASHFMGTNLVMKIMEPVLALGFVIHIFYASVITLANQKARPVGYKTFNPKGSSTWASRNMYILGSTIFVFLVLHIINFFWKIKFGEVPDISYEGVDMHNTYLLVSSLFINYWWYNIIYISGVILLSLHLSHSFWAAFQTLGWSNDKLRYSFKTIAIIYAFVIGIGFAVIPLFFLIFR